jgi:hypothetical protein
MAAAAHLWITNSWITNFAGRLFSSAGLLLLTACVTPAAGGDSVPETLGEGSCREAAVQHLIGRQLTSDVEAAARSRSGASMVRVIRPGEAVSMDHQTHRLNLDVDPRRRIVRVYCG